MKSEAKVVAGSLGCVAMLLAVGQPRWLQQKMYPQNAALQQSLSGATEVRLVRGDEGPLVVLKGPQARVLADGMEIIEPPLFTSLLGVGAPGNLCADPGGYVLEVRCSQKPVAQFSYSQSRSELGSPLWRGFKTLTPDSQSRLDALLQWPQPVLASSGGSR